MQNAITMEIAQTHQCLEEIVLDDVIREGAEFVEKGGHRATGHPFDKDVDVIVFAKSAKSPQHVRVSHAQQHLHLFPGQVGELSGGRGQLRAQVSAAGRHGTDGNLKTKKFKGR